MVEEMKEPLLKSFGGLLSQKESSERTFALFAPPPSKDEPRQPFPQNTIVSSRYNIINFFPKSLFEQFRRLANVYFLVLGIIAAVAANTNYYETAVQPEGILGPMVLVVLISIIKEGIEDLKRHYSDMKINAKPAKRLQEDGSVVVVDWKDLKVGDTVLILDNDEIPADCVVLFCGGVQGPSAYVETAAIDGETNLKLKSPCLLAKTSLGNTDASDSGRDRTAADENAVTMSAGHDSISGLQHYKGSSIAAEAANGSIHRFNGVAELVLRGEEEQRTLSEKNLLLRGCVLRATEWAVCVVVYTGPETKIALNSKKTPSKLSSVDRVVNRTLAVAIGVMLLVCVISMAFGIQWVAANDDADYLCLHSDDLDDRYPNGGGCENSNTSSVLTIFTFATLYNNFVCISMYVSLEMCYLAQSYFLSNDLKLYDETKDTAAECHNSGMCADLGQVNYVLSDKTGTLTKNQMVVQQFSLADKVFGDPVSVHVLDPIITSGVTSPDQSMRAYSQSSGGDPVAAAAGSSTVSPGGFALTRGPSYPPTTHSTSDDSSPSQMNPMTATVTSTTGSNAHLAPGPAGVGGARVGGQGRRQSISNIEIPASPLHTIQDLAAGSSSSNNINGSGSAGESLREAWLRRQFVRNLVYCNTAMLMPDEKGRVNVTDMDSLAKCLQAESPDEVSLILAAAEHCGVLLTARNAHYIECKGLQKYWDMEGQQQQQQSTAKGAKANKDSDESKDSDDASKGVSADYRGPAETVELLAVNEFDSDRKMMSILLRYTDTDLPDGKSSSQGAASSRIVLLCKGADSSMLRNCVNEATPYTSICMAHIDAFANLGLRTLVAACRTVPENEAAQWLGKYKDAANSLVNRGEMLTACAREIETGMTLLGAIGIEDELQDGVPEAISTLHEAEVNVWMITGDKAETALAIGKKCNLIDLERQHVERMVNLADEALRQRVLNLHSYVFLRKHRQEELNRRRGNQQSTPVASSSGDTPSLNSGIPVRGTGGTASGINSEVRSSSLNRDSEPETEADSAELSDQGAEMALVVDGISLEGLWASAELKQKFVETVQLIPTVIACRVSPLQKAALVRMIKAAPEQPVTLAIGDGANDVGMIHEARVGVGISGNEGRHAANSADFAVSQFRFLVTLMFDHGRFNYIRCSKLVLYSFFKNLVLVSLLFYFCSYSGWSGTVPLDSLVFAGYNFYLGLPILVVGAMDFDIPREDVLRYPALAYATGRNGEMLNIANMTRWCILAFIEGLLLFSLFIRIIGGPTWVYGKDGIFSFNIFGTGMNNPDNGWGLGMYPEGFTMYTTAVVAMSYKVVSLSITPNIIFWFVWILSFLGYFFFVYLYGLFPQAGFFNVLPLCMGHPSFWLSLLLIPIMLSIMDYAVDVFWSIVTPSSRDILVEKLRQDEKSRTSKGRRSSSGVALHTMTENTSSPGRAPVVTEL